MVFGTIEEPIVNNILILGPFEGFDAKMLSYHWIHYAIYGSLAFVKSKSSIILMYKTDATQSQKQTLNALFIPRYFRFIEHFS